MIEINRLSKNAKHWLIDEKANRKEVTLKDLASWLLQGKKMKTPVEPREGCVSDFVPGVRGRKGKAQSTPFCER